MAAVPQFVSLLCYRNWCKICWFLACIAAIFMFVFVAAFKMPFLDVFIATPSKITFIILLHVKQCPRRETEM